MTADDDVDLLVGIAAYLLSFAAYLLADQAFERIADRRARRRAVRRQAELVEDLVAVVLAPSSNDEKMKRGEEAPKTP